MVKLGAIPLPLKKVLSILLLLVFLFNVGGYYIVFWGLRFQADRELTHRLDANLYERKETIELRITMTLPYPVTSGDFERVDGRFEHKGQHYKLVKRKFQNDTLYVVCIRDHATRELVSAMTSVIELTQGLQNRGNSQKTLDYVSKLIKDFYAADTAGILDQAVYTILMHLTERPDRLIQFSIPVHSPPPRG